MASSINFSNRSPAVSHEIVVTVSSSCVSVSTPYFKKIGPALFMTLEKTSEKKARKIWKRTQHPLRFQRIGNANLNTSTMDVSTLSSF